MVLTGLWKNVLLTNIIMRMLCVGTYLYGIKFYCNIYSNRSFIEYNLKFLLNDFHKRQTIETK